MLNASASNGYAPNMLTTPLSRRSSSQMNISWTCSLDSGSIGFGVNMVISSAEVDHHVPSASPFKRESETGRAVVGEDESSGRGTMASAPVAGASGERESQDEGSEGNDDQRSEPDSLTCERPLA